MLQVFLRVWGWGGGWGVIDNPYHIAVFCLRGPIEGTSPAFQFQEGVSSQPDEPASLSGEWLSKCLREAIVTSIIYCICLLAILFSLKRGQAAYFLSIEPFTQTSKYGDIARQMS